MVKYNHSKWFYCLLSKRKRSGKNMCSRMLVKEWVHACYPKVQQVWSQSFVSPAGQTCTIQSTAKTPSLSQPQMFVFYLIGINPQIVGDQACYILLSGYLFLRTKIYSFRTESWILALFYTAALVEKGCPCSWVCARVDKVFFNGAVLLLHWKMPPLPFHTLAWSMKRGRGCFLQ